MRSFEKVTGPKKDDWLVKTIGLLISVSGLSLLRSALSRKVSPETTFNAIGQAFSIGSISLIYSLKGRIPKLYLLDATAEFTLLLLWYSAMRRRADIT